MESGSTNYGSSKPLAVQIKENLEADPFITYSELSELLQVPPRTLARRMKELQSSAKYVALAPPRTAIRKSIQHIEEVTGRFADEVETGSFP